MKFLSIEDLVKIPKELAKAYTEGIYADTPANRKLGRVGMSYAAYAEKVKGKEKKESNKEDIEFNLIEAERGIYDLHPNPVELKPVSSYVRKISARDSKSGGIEYEVFLEFKNGNKIDSKTERLNSQSEVKKWIKEKIKKENSSKDKKDDNFIKSITNQLQESLNENSIYCYEVNTKETKEGNTIFEAICSKDDLAGITTMDKSGQKLKENLRPLLGGLELQDISLTNYKGEKQIKLIFDF